MLVDWSKLYFMDVQESFDFKKNSYFINKPKWMDRYCVNAVRKKYKAWQIYIHSTTK